jgi:hypothetical protein
MLVLSFPQEGGELRADTMNKSATTRLETCLRVPTPVRRPPRYLVEKALVPDREKLGHPTGATTRSVGGTSEIGTDKDWEESSRMISCTWGPADWASTMGLGLATDPLVLTLALSQDAG